MYLSLRAHIPRVAFSMAETFSVAIALTSARVITRTPFDWLNYSIFTDFMPTSNKVILRNFSGHRISIGVNAE